MALIVNLSSIHTLHPIEKSIGEFTNLCNKYSGGCSSACPDFFRSMSNKAWVKYQYYMNYKELIEPYKLGKINTSKFLHGLLKIFDFLDKVKPGNNDLKEYYKYRVFTENEINDESEEAISKNYKFFLLEKAWNEIIGLDNTSSSRFPELVLRAQNETVYLISNTNELNVSKIIQLLKFNNPKVKFNKSIDISVKEENNPIEIAPNIFLCLSYRYQLFKTEENNREINPNSTMSLIKSLVDWLTKKKDVDRDDIQVISQYPKDLTQAKNIGINKKNTHSDDEFFNTKELKYVFNN